MVSFWEELRRRMSSADSAESRMEMGISFGTAPFTLFFMSWSSRSFCLLWLVTVVAPLSAVTWLAAWSERDPWADSLGQLADGSLELALGAYPVDNAEFWTPPAFLDAGGLGY